MTVSMLVCAIGLGAARAETVPLTDIPKLPEDTALFEAEKAFGSRGKIGGFALKPDRYGIFHTEEGWIQVMYEKKPGPQFVGCYIIVLGDLSRYETVQFKIKGEKGGETFEIGMNDTVSNKREDAVFVGSIHRYLEKGITTEWQDVTIPLAHFFGPDLTRVYSLVFHFNEPGHGTFWIDNMRFGTEPYLHFEDTVEARGHLLLDDFDHASVNLLGRKANAYKKLPSYCVHSLTDETYVGGRGRSLRLDYAKKSTGWCGYYTLLNEIDGDYYDLSRYKSVSFWVRGARGGEEFEIGMADKNWLNIGDSLKAGPVTTYLPVGVTTEWQEVTIPLEDFGKLDFTVMGSFVINFHRKQEGTVFIDDLRFNLKSEEDLLKGWEF
ncbi:MAG: hypothetical protein HYY14_06650 [Candidatus Omnitrophica bacterium]|nr:hypothetical protein [Candidatus Omnitrophota bacterium]